MNSQRDHGGGIDAAIKQYGGARKDWLDLSTGINPEPFPLPNFAPNVWGSLPDKRVFSELEAATRSFWNVPTDAAILAAPGASSLIARIPYMMENKGGVRIIEETYNEHAAAFRSAGWEVSVDGNDAAVTVHPNNPTADFIPSENIPRTPLRIIDESFCDVVLSQSHINLASDQGTLILKSFGKFWGLAGMRLGFAIGDPKLIDMLRETLGPWQVSGPALATGIAALRDPEWAENTRSRLKTDALRMDTLMRNAGATPVSGTTLFQLYHVDDAQKWHEKLARSKILSRIFPYSKNWLRLGLPSADRWEQLEQAL